MKKKNTETKLDDCNIENIKKIGKIAVKLAILDYKNGDLADDIFEQIGRVLFMMQDETKNHFKN